MELGVESWVLIQSRACQSAVFGLPARSVCRFLRFGFASWVMRQMNIGFAVHAGAVLGPERNARPILEVSMTPIRQTFALVP